MSETVRTQARVRASELVGRNWLNTGGKTLDLEALRGKIVPVLDLGNCDPSRVTRGQVSEESGRITGETLKAMIDLATSASGHVLLAHLARDERDAQSHEVAVRLRPMVEEVARRYGASAKVAEIPPGPPVLATLTDVRRQFIGDALAAGRTVPTAFDTARAQGADLSGGYHYMKLARMAYYVHRDTYLEHLDRLIARLE